MTPHYRLKRLTAYPEWHKTPFLLNRAEMANPYTVLTEFFDRYDLSQIRVSLKQWLTDALDGREAEAASHFYTHESVAKLVEAAWVIFEQRRQGQAAEGFEKILPTGEEQYNDDKDDENRPRFVKWTTFPVILKANPIEYLQRVFQTTGFDGLETIIDRWQRIALAADYERYDKAEERADLLDYCEGIHRLIEATYILQRQKEWETEGRVRYQLSDEIKYDLLTEEQTFRLSEEEMANPYRVIASFFETFTPAYARQELWDMLGCVVECKQEDLKRLDLLLDYECLYGLLEAAWLYHNQRTIKEQGSQESKIEGA